MSPFRLSWGLQAVTVCSGDTIVRSSEMNLCSFLDNFCSTSGHLIKATLRPKAFVLVLLVFTLSFVLLGLIFCCDCNAGLWTLWLKTKQIYHLTVGDVRSVMGVSHWTKIKVLAGLHLFLEAVRENSVFLPSTVSRGCLRSSAHVPPSSKPAAGWVLLTASCTECLSSFSFPLFRTSVITFGPRR